MKELPYAFTTTRASYGQEDAFQRRAGGGSYFISPIETVNVHAASLRKLGYSILEFLLARSPAVVLRQELERHLWADDPPGSDALRTHIATLRAEVDRGEGTALLHTHRGVGYQMAVIEPVRRHD